MCKAKSKGKNKLLDHFTTNMYLNDVVNGALHTGTKTGFTGSGSISRFNVVQHESYTARRPRAQTTRIAPLDRISPTVPEHCHVTQHAAQIQIEAMWGKYGFWILHWIGIQRPVWSWRDPILKVTQSVYKSNSIICYSFKKSFHISHNITITFDSHPLPFWFI